MRLRYTRKGWFRYWMMLETGTKDLRTGAVRPDAQGLTSREIWVGPFAAASLAMGGLR